MRRLTAVLAVLVLLLGSHAVLAQPGVGTDPDDSMGSPDIRAVYHADTANGVEYVVESYDDFPNEGLSCTWDLDLNGDRLRDGQVVLRAEQASLVVEVLRGSQVVGKGSAARSAAGSPHQTATSTDANSVKVTVPMSALRAAGLPASATAYDYIVWCENAGGRDQVPNTAQFPGIRHELGGDGQGGRTNGSGEPGSRDDKDDVTSTPDVRRAYQYVRGAAIEYFVESYSNFANEQAACSWHLDFDGDGTKDADLSVASSGDDLSATVYSASGSMIGRGEAVRSAVAPPHESATSTPTNTLKVTVDRSLYGAAGLAQSDADYDYVLECGGDVVPDGGLFPGIHHAMAPGAAECPGHAGDPRPDLVGTPGNDVLAAADDAIVCGLGGNDVLRAGGGGAVLEAGDGSDILCARQNSPGDVLDGGPGLDRGRWDNADSATGVERFADLVLCA